MTWFVTYPPLRLPCFDRRERLDSEPFSRQSGVAVYTHHGRVNVPRQFPDHRFRLARITKLGYELMSQAVIAQIG